VLSDRMLPLQRLLLLGLTVLGCFGWSETGDACSCVRDAHAYLVWPEPGATDVAPNTALVLSGMFSAAELAPVALPKKAGDSSLPSQRSPAIFLLSDDGQVVPLEMVSAAATEHGCRNTLFVKPKYALAMNTYYQLILDTPSNRGEPIRGDFFTGEAVIDSSAQEQTAHALMWETLGASDDPNRMIMAYVIEPAGGPPLFFFGGALSSYRSVQRSFQPFVHAIPLAFATCPTIDVYGSTGDLLVSKSLCEAERCVPRKRVGPGIGHSCDNSPAWLNYADFRALRPGCVSSPKH
jgi:hypothetical protein